MKRTVLFSLFIFHFSLFIFHFSLSSAQTTIEVQPADNAPIVPKEIYGQFAEHLGRCIYGGLWEDNHYRADVLEALQALHVPVLRWPGGCFADNYHWKVGIGENRPKMVNTNWGGTTEDNSFGTHEFLNLCQLLNAEPYVSLNVGSGSVQEMAEWVEYMTSADDTPMANLRRQNGQQEPWAVHYIGIGNESWGCGGQMRPEYYSDLYRQYAEYCRSFSGNRLFKVASGASDYDYAWTECLMKNIGHRMQAISLHYYTVLTWDGPKGKAADFTDDEYYWTLGKALGVEPVLQKHIAIMDKYDPEGRIKLFLDEWGTWFDEEESTIPGHLYQQNTMRDAMVAALSLNIFHQYVPRLAMANIAQIANVLQAMVLTEGDKMILTPTYHVFRQYAVHQNARLIPLHIQTTTVKEAKIPSSQNIPAISATMTENGGLCHLSIAHTELDKSQTVTITLPEKIKAASISAEILTAKHPTAHNSFEAPDVVSPAPFKAFQLSKDGRTLTLQLPPCSILTLQFPTP